MVSHRILESIIWSPLATKLLYVVFFHGDLIQLEPKTSRLWYTCAQSIHQVTAESVQYLQRYLSFSADRSSIFLPPVLCFVLCLLQLWYNYTRAHFLIFTAAARRAAVVIMSRSLSVCVCVCVSVYLWVLSLQSLPKRPSSFCLIHFSGAPQGQLGGSLGVKADLRWKTTFDGRKL